MIVTEMYNGLYKILTNDPEILQLLEIDTYSSEPDLLLKKADKVQKRKKAQNLTDNIPIISFYTTGGGVDPNNSEVYGSTFIFDVYTNDDIDRAHKITDRICELFNNEILPIPKITTFEAVWVDSFESDIDLANIYRFTSIINIFVGLDTN